MFLRILIGRRMRLVPLAAAAVILFLTAHPAMAHRELITSTWDLGGDGFWNVATNWDPEGVPNNVGGNTYDVLIEGGRGDVVVTLDMAATIDNLTIDQGDVLYIDNGWRLYMAGTSITNDGVISLNATTSNTYFTIQGADVQISSPLATGCLILGSDAQNYVSGNVGSYLTNCAGHTICGAGDLGCNYLALINDGLIDANDPAGQMLIDPPGAYDFVNYAIMQASGGGTLNFHSDTVDNSAGVIQALDGSTVLFAGGDIVGGSITCAGTGAVQATSGDSTLTGITVDGVIHLPNASNLTLAGTTTLNAPIQLQSTGSNTNLKMQGDAYLTGPGSIILGDHVNNRLYITGGGVLTNVDSTIEGAGQFGLNIATIINQSLVDANLPTQMTVDPGDGGLTNEGILQASDGGKLRLASGTYDNSAGVIQVQDGSTVELDGCTIIGGDLLDSTTGVIWPGGSPPTLENVNIVDTFEIPNARYVNIADSLITHGVVQVNSTGSNTTIVCNGEVQFTGGGVIDLSDYAQNRIYCPSGAGWTNVDNTIQGAGQLGLNTSGFTNQALIDANLPTMLTLDPDEDGVINEGILRASGGGTLRFNYGEFYNEMGTIEALDDSQVELCGCRVIGGELVSTGTGTLGPGSSEPVIEDVSIVGTFSIPNARYVTLAGTINNTGVIDLASTGSNTDIHFDGDVTLTGGGDLHMSDHFNNRIYDTNQTARLINEDNLIHGSGQIGVGFTRLTNQATIAADGAFYIRLKLAGDDNYNTGVIEARDGGTLKIDATTIDNAGGVIRAADASFMEIDPVSDIIGGTFLVDVGGKLTSLGDFNQPHGTTIVNGTLTTSTTGYKVHPTGGVITGNGLIDAEVINEGTIEPGASVGELSIEGDYSQPRFGILTIEMTGTEPGEYDVLTVDGDASVNGTILMTPVGGFEPMLGDEFTILTATGEVTGTPRCIPPYRFICEEHAVVAVVIDEPDIADLNCDGNVDIEDLFMVLGAWGVCPDPPHPCREDIDLSGAVDIDDLFLVLANWT